MTTSRDIRRLAFQALYQLDARADEEPDAILAAMMTDQDDDVNVVFAPGDLRRAFSLAKDAYVDRAAADAFALATAPTWPSHRQAAVDRAILRLAHYEITKGEVPPKVAVNEAVELAKAYSTDKSASFVNGVLDKLLKSVLKEEQGGAEGGASEERADGAAEAGSSEVAAS